MIKKIKLRIPSVLIHEPIIYKMVTQFDIIPNILTARLDQESEGEVVMEMKGTLENIEKGILYLKELSIDITEQ